LLPFDIRTVKKFVNDKKVLLVGGSLVILVLCFTLINSYTSIFSRPADYAMPADSTTRLEIEVVKPIVLYGMVVNNLHITEDHVRRNQRFADLFDGHSISPKVQQQLNLLSRNVFDFRRISANKKYTLITNNDSLSSVRALVYEPNAIDYIIFHMEDSLLVEACRREVSVIEKYTTGVIKSTLSQTIEALGISNELTNKFVDIFAWQVDFQQLQKGDRFKLIYEVNQVEDKPISIGRIQGIYFEHFNSPYYAFPFDQGGGSDYYDDNGNSLRKALLRYPIEFTRISSRYNLNRFHPIAKVFRAHLGTDFAADTGTPIRSVGDGVVLEAQYKTNNGNYVKIRHNGTYTTGYLHMSKIASGMSPGTRVRQGQTIGFVGSTGLATGPHLCYRFWRNGVQVDALKIELPASDPIKQDQKESYEIAKDKIKKRLDLIVFPPSPEENPVASN
jgi:murein DD-endopeptidase MepM/ murein hydrolase activator NlpD